MFCMICYDTFIWSDTTISWVSQMLSDYDQSLIHECDEIIYSVNIFGDFWLLWTLKYRWMVKGRRVCLILSMFDTCRYWVCLIRAVTEYVWYVPLLSMFDTCRYWVCLIRAVTEYVWYVPLLSMFGTCRYWVCLIRAVTEYVWYVPLLSMFDTEYVWYVPLLSMFDTEYVWYVPLLSMFDTCRYWVCLVHAVTEYVWYVPLLSMFDTCRYWVCLIRAVTEYVWYVPLLSMFDTCRYWVCLIRAVTEYVWYVPLLSMFDTEYVWYVPLLSMFDTEYVWYVPLLSMFGTCRYWVCLIRAVTETNHYACNKHPSTASEPHAEVQGIHWAATYIRATYITLHLGSSHIHYTVSGQPHTLHCIWGATYITLYLGSHIHYTVSEEPHTLYYIWAATYITLHLAAEWTIRSSLLATVWSLDQRDQRLIVPLIGFSDSMNKVWRRLVDIYNRVDVIKQIENKSRRSGQTRL